MPTVLAGEENTPGALERKWGKEISGRWWADMELIFFLCPSYSCITGMLASLLIPSTCLESEVEFENIKIYPR